MVQKLQTFFVEFENNSAVFFAGQTVNGRVLIVLNEPMKMRGVRLRLTGRAYTHWTETRTRSVTVNGQNRTETYTENYSDCETYYTTEVTLWGKPYGSSGDNPTMAPGTYQLPFTFVLPINCPSSFEGYYGHIRYVCTAIIDKPWKFDHTTKRPMTILSLVDLNMMPQATMPITGEQMKTLGCLCCKSGTINCSARLVRSGFVPGEIIPIDMEILNSSSSKVDDVTVCLEERVNFYAQGQCKHRVRTVAVVKKGTTAAGENQTWKNNDLLVPAVAPSLMTCRIINISYVLKFNINPSGMHTDFTFELPIVIGNVPLRMVVQQMQAIFQQSQVGQVPQPSYPSAPPMPFAQNQYPDLPPPSYQNAVFGPTNIMEEGDNKYTMGETSFVPQYPYYNWLSPSPTAPPLNQNIDSNSNGNSVNFGGQQGKVI